MQYNTIDEALEALRQGQCILVIDDPDREKEGDLICAAQFATTENVNLMASLAKGLICMPMSRELCERLNLPQMVTHNSDNQLERLESFLSGTAYTYWLGIRKINSSGCKERQ